MCQHEQGDFLTITPSFLAVKFLKFGFFFLCSNFTNDTIFFFKYTHPFFTAVFYCCYFSVNFDVSELKFERVIFMKYSDLSIKENSLMV